MTALRSRREQMLQALKREQPSTNRSSLLGDGSRSAPQGPPRESDATAERDNVGLVQLQQQVMQQQDTELDALETSVHRTKVGTTKITLTFVILTALQITSC